MLSLRLTRYIITLSLFGLIVANFLPFSTNIGISHEVDRLALSLEDTEDIILHNTHETAHPALIYTIYHFYSKGFDEMNDQDILILMFIMLMIKLAGLFFVVNKLFGLPIAIFATTLAVGNNYMFSYLLNINNFFLAIFFSLMTIYFLDEIYTKGKEWKKKYLAFFDILLIWTNYFAFIIIIAQLIFIIRKERKDFIKLQNLKYVGSIVLFSFIPIRHFLMHGPPDTRAGEIVYTEFVGGIIPSSFTPLHLIMFLSGVVIFLHGYKHNKKYELIMNYLASFIIVVTYFILVARYNFFMRYTYAFHWLIVIITSQSLVIIRKMLQGKIRKKHITQIMMTIAIVGGIFNLYIAFDELDEKMDYYMDRNNRLQKVGDTFFPSEYNLLILEYDGKQGVLFENFIYRIADDKKEISSLLAELAEEIKLETIDKKEFIEQQKKEYKSVQKLLDNLYSYNRCLFSIGLCRLNNKIIFVKYPGDEYNTKVFDNFISKTDDKFLLFPDPKEKMIDANCEIYDEYLYLCVI